MIQLKVIRRRAATIASVLLAILLAACNSNGGRPAY
jgi:predicted small secreted protein